MQGIAALPTGMAPEGAPQEAPAMGSLSAQEAATLGRLLSKVSEDEIEQLRELASDLKEFTGPELRDFLGGVDFIMKNANNYEQSVRNLIQRGVVEPGDLPAEYIPTFYAILRQMIVDAMQQMQGGEEQPEGFAKGGLVSMAQKVKAAGRHGDTMLAHITPREAAMLKQAGGAGTINPKTGLPEYKSFFSKVGSFLKKAAPVILPVALNFVAPGLGAAVGGALGVSAAAGSALVGAVGSGVGGLIAGQKPAQALLSAALGGLGSYAVSSLAPGGISGLLSGGGTGQEALGAANTMTGVTAPGQVGPVAPINPAVQAAAKYGNFAGEGLKNVAQTLTAPGGFDTGQQVSGGLGGLFNGVGNFVKQNPLLTAGLVGAGALAFAGSEDKGTAPIDMGPTGPQLLAQNPAQYGFNIANFRAQPTGPARIIPTPSPAFPSSYAGMVNPYAPRYAKDGGHIAGPGHGTSDSIPAMLSDGEFVLTAKAVRGAGNGDRMKGAKKLYKLMNQLEKRA